MPAARGVKRSASKSSAATASTGPKNKKKRGAIQLEIPSAPKKRGCVFTCGQGDVGQLGLGEDVIETTKFKYVSALGNKIVDARAGGMHTIALDCDGKVWTFGCNDEGALGRAAASDRDEGTPHAVALPAAAVAVAAGDSHSAALTTAGDVYAWGAFRDSHGSMGLVVRGREGKACREPVKVDIGEPAVAIASGGDHLVILSTSGSVYTMGCGEQGQLGRLSQRSASRDTRQGFSALLVPSKVMLKSGASRIWAGYHATFALDATTDKMFAWGLNNYGQLGITGEKRKTAIFSPTWCDAFSSAMAEGAEGGEGGAWAAVAAGQHHTLAADAAGVLHALGRREYGRLGLGEKSGDAEVLEPIPKLQNKKCISIASGTSNSFAVTDDGEVYAWGMGSEGQLGTGGRADCSEPAHVLPVAAPSAAAHTVAVSISAGGQHSVLLQEDPTAQKEASPAPDKEMEEEKVENVEKEEKRPNKRQKKQEQDEEISSTSSAQPADVAVEKPEKVNGNEKKEPEIEPETETPMEVDDTDKAQDNKDDKQIDEPMEQTDSEKSQDTSSQEGTDVETKADDLTDTPDTAQTAPAQAQTTPDQAQAQTQPQAQDTEVNGTVETKPVVLTTA